VDFAALVERLVAERRPSWRVHRSVSPEPGRDRFDQCRDAWNLRVDDGAWWIIRGWGAERTESAFARESAACAALYEHVVASEETGVRALAPAELPEPARRLVRAAGLDGVTPRPGDLFVAAAPVGMGLRLVETTDGIRVDHPSVRPPTVGDTWFAGLTLDDAARVVMAVAGQRLPVVPGVAWWGVPGSYRSQAETALRRFAGVPLERIERAYVGEPEGLLDLLVPPAALDLLTADLVTRAARHGYALSAYGGPDRVVLDAGDNIRLSLRRVTDGFVVEHCRERATTWDLIGTYPDLEAARAALGARLA